MKPVRDWLHRHNVPYLGVWQRQRKRGLREGNEGEWHYHLLLGQRVTISTLRAFVVARGWGPQINVKPVADPDDVIRYMCRYFTRDCRENERFVRLSIRPMAHRIGNVKFGWIGGIAFVWRQGCAAMAKKARGYYKPDWEDRENILLAGCASLKLETRDLLELGLARLIGWTPALSTPPP